MAKGYVEPLPSGRFRAVVSAGADPITGRRVKVTEVCDTEGAARIACDRLVDQVEAEATPDRTANVATLMQTWLDVADHEVSTASTARRYVKRQIVPALGHVPVRKLQHRVDLIDRFYVHLRRCGEVCDGRPREGHTCKPLAPATIRQIHAWLSRALSYAVSWGWIERNPAQFAHPPKLAHRQARPPEPEEVARLLNKAFAEDSQFGLYLWLAVTTGARRAELAALRWHRVRMNRAELNIERNYLVIDGQHIEKTTKTDSDRHLALDGISIDLLAAYRAALEGAIAPAGLQLADDSFVFSPNPAGLRPWNPSHFTHRFRHYADAVGIEEPLKNLRHFNATQLLAAGVDLRTTAARLGHSGGGATTLRVYASATQAADRAAAEGLAQGLTQLRNPSGGSSEPMAVRRLAGAPVSILGEPGRAGDYTVIAERIVAAIEAGALRSSDPLPTLVQLGEHFAVAPSTARRAIVELAERGLVRKEAHRWICE